jgi:iron complex outermembrane recepter protein
MLSRRSFLDQRFWCVNLPHSTKANPEIRFFGRHVLAHHPRYTRMSECKEEIMEIRRRNPGIWLAQSIVVLATILLIAGICRAQSEKALLAGSIKDPSGLGIPGARLTIVDTVSGVLKSTASDTLGRYRLPDLPAGKYRLTVTYQGFAPHSQEVVLDNGAAQRVDVTLQLRPSKEFITVSIQQPAMSGSALRGIDVVPPHAFDGDSAQLLDGQPGIGLYGNGGVSRLPVIHGMADDRLRIKVNGMDLISACGNHMNPPLSYIDPSRVGSFKVFAGITPVSMGGDSIGGTISVDSPPARFAGAGHGLLLDGQAGTYYRSNGDGYGANLGMTIAGEKLSLTYSGSLTHSDNYKSSKDFKAGGLAAIDRGLLAGNEVGSSRYESQNHALGFALRHNNHLMELMIGLQHIPHQGFPNQRMDMTRNDSLHANLRYRGQFQWGALDARIYTDYTRHSMDFADDKQYFYGSAATILAPGMPMETKGLTLGGLVKAEIPLTKRDLLRVGVEGQRYRLNDWWPPSPSVLPPGYTAGGMAPDTFININNGQRNRIGVYAEWEANWNPKWMSLLGLRNETILMDTGIVHGYNNTMMYNGAPLFPATTFNGRDRKRTDNNFDITAVSRYTPGDTLEFEAGYALKTRSPNLYERYTWSINTMAMEMINFAGDGNYYLGNLDLKPESAHTISTTASWHASAREQRGISVSPYYSYIQDYIDARRCPATVVCGSSAAVKASETATRGFVYLQFVNQSSRIYGIDVSGHSLLAQSHGLGSFTATGTMSLARGKNRTTNDNLYNIMPVTAKLAIVHSLGNWTNTIEEQLVGGKRKLSRVRNEIGTGGYSLLNVRSSYGWRSVRLDIGLENIFDKFYAPPLGGTYVGQGATMSGSAIPWGIPIAGMGRSLYAGLTFTIGSD